MEVNKISLIRRGKFRGEFHSQTLLLIIICQEQPLEWMGIKRGYN